MIKEFIYLEKDHHIAWLTLNRACKKNALNYEMWRAIPSLLEKAENDPHIKVLIIYSAVKNIFCAGADLSEFNLFITDEQARDKNSLAMQAASQAIEDFPKPTIAMISGPCMGGGCILALSCDLRFADKTSRFAIPPAKLGLVYSLADTRRLMDNVGPAAAKSLLYSAGVINADKALQIGLINEIFSEEEIEQETRDYAKLISNNSSHSLQEIKKVTRRIQSGIRDDDDLSRGIFKAAFDGQDHKEGVEAFLNKRKPSY